MVGQTHVPPDHQIHGHPIPFCFSDFESELGSKAPRLCSFAVSVRSPFEGGEGLGGIPAGGQAKGSPTSTGGHGHQQLAYRKWTPG